MQKCNESVESLVQMVLLKFSSFGLSEDRASPLISSDRVLVNEILFPKRHFFASLRFCT